MNNKRKNIYDEFIHDELNNNIYPSLHEVVKNRYYILLGIFAYYAFRLLNNDAFEKISLISLDLGVSIFFAFLVVHNFFNYRIKSYAIRNLIKKDISEKCPGILMEGLFAFITVVLIIFGYIVLPK